MLRYLLSLVIISSIVDLTYQVGFSLNDNPNKQPSSPERKPKHETYIKNYQNYQKICGKQIIESEKLKTSLTNFIIQADNSLDLNDTSIQNKSFFGCMCQQFKLLRDDKTLNSEALGPFFDAAADEDSEAVEIQTKCNAAAEELMESEYRNACFHVFSCIHDFDDDND